MSNHSTPLLLPFSDFLESIRGSTRSDHSLGNVLSLLFEPSPILLDNLAPNLLEQLNNANDSDTPRTYAELIDQALAIAYAWPFESQAEFVGGHPRIGEVKGLSALSAAEQGQSQNPSSTNIPAPTPPEILSRLAQLNAMYERRYPGLVYITFVNGRSRAEIRDEMQDRLSSEGVLPNADEAGGLDEIVPHDVPSEAWCKEVERAVDDVGKIAKSRLINLGFE